ncbi:putative PIN family toxin of toxin-antitoxin system, partial [Humitalea rosea]
MPLPPFSEATARVVFDASSLVGALLKQGSVPERALELARLRDIICLSKPVEEEVRSVFARPRFRHYAARAELILAVLAAAAQVFDPGIAVTDCRDVKDNKYLELALAADAAAIVSSDQDLLVLNGWRGVAILSPADYLRRREIQIGAEAPCKSGSSAPASASVGGAVAGERPQGPGASQPV